VFQWTITPLRSTAKAASAVRHFIVRVTMVPPNTNDLTTHYIEEDDF
jgi:hypothetical protein